MENEKELRLLEDILRENNLILSVTPESEKEKLYACVNVRKKGNMILYNYNDNVLVDRNHPLLCMCRGLVIDSVTRKILNFPFKRFFNHYEKECEIDMVSWDSTEIQEKVDGSLICVFWNGTEWEVTTRGSFYSGTETGTENVSEKYVDFSLLFKENFKNFNILDNFICYVFELVTDKNRIVTMYDENRVYLIGARNIDTFTELSQKSLDEIAVRLSVYRPRRFKANDVDDCKKLFEQFRQDEEGLVVVDEHNMNDVHRVKIKQDCYLKLSKIKQLSEQDLFDCVLGKMKIDSEFLHIFPDIQKTMISMSEQYNDVMVKIQMTFERIILTNLTRLKDKNLTQLKDKSTRKDFAIEAIKYPYKSVLFSMYDGKTFEHMKWEEVKTWIMEK